MGLRNFAESPNLYVTGENGIRFDLNDGIRVLLPEGKAPCRVRMSDLGTGNILYETEIKAGRGQAGVTTKLWSMTDMCGLSRLGKRRGQRSRGISWWAEINPLGR